MVSERVYFLEIGSVDQGLWPFKCMMLKALYSNFLGWGAPWLMRAGAMGDRGFGFLSNNFAGLTDIVEGVRRKSSDHLKRKRGHSKPRPPPH